MYMTNTPNKAVSSLLVVRCKSFFFLTGVFIRSRDSHKGKFARLLGAYDTLNHDYALFTSTMAFKRLNVPTCASTRNTASRINDSDKRYLAGSIRV